MIDYTPFQVRENVSPAPDVNELIKRLDKAKAEFDRMMAETQKSAQEALDILRGLK